MNISKNIIINRKSDRNNSISSNLVPLKKPVNILNYPHRYKNLFVAENLNICEMKIKNQRLPIIINRNGNLKSTEKLFENIINCSKLNNILLKYRRNFYNI